MEMAKLISDEDFQKIWGKILADECSDPGTIPKSVLFILQKMDKDDALSFTNLCSLVINVCGEETPFISQSFFQVTMLMKTQSTKNLELLLIILPNLRH